MTSSLRFTSSESKRARNRVVTVEVPPAECWNLAGYGDVLSPGLRIHHRRSRGRRSDLLKDPIVFYSYDGHRGVIFEWKIREIEWRSSLKFWQPGVKKYKATYWVRRIEFPLRGFMRTRCKKKSSFSNTLPSNMFANLVFLIVTFWKMLMRSLVPRALLEAGRETKPGTEVPWGRGWLMGFSLLSTITAVCHRRLSSQYKEPRSGEGVD